MPGVTQTVKHLWTATVTIPVVFTTTVSASNRGDAAEIAWERALELGSAIDFNAEQDGYNAHYQDGFDVEVVRDNGED